MDKQALRRVLTEFATSTPARRADFLKRHATVLLSDEARNALSTNLERYSGAQDAEAIAVLESLIGLVDLCRNHGVDDGLTRFREETRRQWLGELAAAAHDLRRDEADALIIQVRDLASEDEWADTNAGLVAAILAAECPGAVAWASDEIRNGADGSSTSMGRYKTLVRGGIQLLEVTGDESDEAREHAIAHLEHALALSADVEGKVTGLRPSLAHAYQHRRAGDERENLKRAEELLEAEIRDVTFHNSPPERASLTLDLIMTKALLGETEAAIRLFGEGLDAGAPGSSTETDDLLGLANLLTETHGPASINAIDAAIDVLTVAARRAPSGSLEWGRIQLSLSNMWRIRIRGTPVDNSENAVAAAHNAERVFARERHPDEWAQAQHNLGAIYYGRVGGERADDLEMAIAQYQCALTVHTRDAYPKYFGLTSSSLGQAFLQRIEGDRYENNNRAEKHLRDAEETLDPEEQPMWWAESQTGLSEVYRQRLGPNRRADLERTVSHLDEARRTYEAIGDRQRTGESLSNLAATYIDLGELESRYYEKAVRFIETALALVDQTTDPYHWALYQRNLGAVLSRIEAPNLDRASPTVRALESSLEVFTPDTYPREYQETQAMLGHIHFESGDWDKALLAYEHAIRTGDVLLAATYTEAGREYTIAQTHLIYPRAAWCLLQKGDPTRALEILEAGKTRRLREALSLAKHDISRLNPRLARRLSESGAAVRGVEAQKAFYPRRGCPPIHGVGQRPAQRSCNPCSHCRRDPSRRSRIPSFSPHI